jgi:polar amino acid transport system substrate-binding protein
MTLKTTAALVLAVAALSGQASLAQDACAKGKTIAEGSLTVATGNPAYFPWVIDNDPSTGKGFEAAVAYEIAARLGFAKENVVWTTTSFDQAIQPGAKEFDFNIQQYSITAERDQTIDFSAPYYTAAPAVVVRKSTVEAGAQPTGASLKGLVWGAAAGTTALELINKLITPESDVMLYDDTADLTEAMKANQIDATLVDLPTALYLAAAVMEDGVVLGQYPADATGGLDQFGAVFADGNPLRDCVSEAIGAMVSDGTLAKIEAEWLEDATGVPMIQ